MAKPSSTLIRRCETRAAQSSRMQAGGAQCSPAFVDFGTRISNGNDVEYPPQNLGRTCPGTLMARERLWREVVSIEGPVRVNYSPAEGFEFSPLGRPGRQTSCCPIGRQTRTLVNSVHPCPGRRLAKHDRGAAGQIHRPLALNDERTGVGAAISPIVKLAFPLIRTGLLGA